MFKVKKFCKEKITEKRKKEGRRKEEKERGGKEGIKKGTKD